ncbi:hypothetical protein TNCV_2217131 [Trichonephila clavipes]|nr:hypothetical protein TNCV_2217131 [Trichonephila clavipes]
MAKFAQLDLKLYTEKFCDRYLPFGDTLNENLQRGLEESIPTVSETLSPDETDSVAIEVSTRPKQNGIVPDTAFLHVLRRRLIGCPDLRKRSPDVMNMIESNIE